MVRRANSFLGVWFLAGAWALAVMGASSSPAGAGDDSRSGGEAASAETSVLAGIDVLRAEKFSPLAGSRVGLIANHTAIAHDDRSTLEILHAAQAVELVALFSPEHGFAGELDQSNIADARDDETGLKIHSLYGQTRKPTPENLQGIDVLVFDIQDIGTRFYTYISTMGLAMQAAAENNIRFVVLDRPNPLGGTEVQGPVLDAGEESFVGFHPISVRHGMTVGELARMFQEELDLDLDLTIVPVKNWRREQFFDQTGLLWTNPSPNMRSLTEALLYPGIGLIETTNVSVGRGTDTPFEVLGAPWIEPRALAADLNAAPLGGVAFVPIYFTPTSSKYEGERCGGVNLIITDRDRFHPLRTGLAVAAGLARLYPEQWSTGSLNRLLADAKVRDAILRGEPVDRIQAAYQDELERFRRRRAEFLIY